MANLDVVTPLAYLASSVLIQLALALGETAAAFLTSRPAARVLPRSRTHENPRGTYRDTCTGKRHMQRDEYGWC
jgi:hypothetical protein